MKSKDQISLEEAYERILETLDSPYPIQNQKKGFYSFTTDPNKEPFYTVELTTDKLYPGTILANFYYNNGKGQRTQLMIGTGNAFKVMATVIKITKEYISKNKDNFHTLQFSSAADERGKTKLYHRLAKELQTFMGPEWKLNTYKDSLGTTEDFEITKN